MEPGKLLADRQPIPNKDYKLVCESEIGEDPVNPNSKPGQSGAAMVCEGQKPKELILKVTNILASQNVS